MNSKTKIQNENFFPELNIQNLKVLYVEEWIREYPDIPIERVTLYHYRPDTHDYIRYHRGDNGRRSSKYAIVFDFSDEAELSECDFLKIPGESHQSVVQRLPLDASIAELLKAAEPIKTNPCIEFIKGKLEYPDLPSGRFFGLLNSAFCRNVYHADPPHSFYEDWIFLPRWKGRVSVLEAAGRVKTDSPHCVLFERSVCGSQKQSVGIANENEYRKREILKKAGALAISSRWAEVDAVCKPALLEAERKWAGGDEATHIEMGDYLWSKYKELRQHNSITQKSFVNRLKPIADKYNRVIGKRGVKKAKDN